MSQDNPDLNPTGSGSTAAGRPIPPTEPAQPTDAGAPTSTGAFTDAPTESFGTTSGDAPTEALGTTSTTARGTAPDTARDTAPGTASSTDLPARPELPGDLVVLASARPSLGARLGAEALGTFVLVLLGVGVALYTPLSGATTLGVALAFAFAFTAAAIALGHVSGGHFNPAVTFGAVIAGRTPIRDLVPYWLAQLIGGALAAAALFVTLPEQLAVLIGQESRRQLFSNTANGYGDHSPLYTQSQGQVTFELMPALLIELVATAVLVGIILAASSRRVSHAVAPVAMGLTYGALVLLAAPITNAGLNPARSTASSLFSDGWALEQLWLFWAAPLVGAAIAGLAHRAFAVDAGPENLLEEDDVVVDEDSLLDDDAGDITVGSRV